MPGAGGQRSCSLKTPEPVFPATKRRTEAPELSLTAARTSSSERGERQVEPPGERGEAEAAAAEASAIPEGDASAALAETAAANWGGGASFLPTSSTSWGVSDRAASMMDR